jgi:hypothetical protein
MSTIAGQLSQNRLLRSLLTPRFPRFVFPRPENDALGSIDMIVDFTNSADPRQVCISLPSAQP